VLRRAIIVSVTLLVVGVILFASSMSHVTPYEHTQGAIGIMPIIGMGLSLIGFIGVFAGVTTWLLTTMTPIEKKDET
jgi:uncharacterized BrkB/YihY/UPF0761 family membrane protein